MKFTPKETREYLYVFFDGDCGFCSFWVQYLLQHDRKDVFRFASLQGKTGQKFLQERNLNQTDFNTLYVWQPTQAYWQKSAAVLKIVETLGGFFLLSKILKLFPTFLLDAVYTVIATNRHRLLKPKCLLPSAEQRKKFLD